MATMGGLKQEAHRAYEGTRRVTVKPKEIGGRRGRLIRDTGFANQEERTGGRKWGPIKLKGGGRQGGETQVPF